MANIESLLAQILSARFGKDVRQSIHDAIAQCYDDVSNPTLNTKAFYNAIVQALAEGILANLTIAEGSVTTDKLADQAVTAAKIAAQTITEDEIKDLAITAAKIANGAITADKMSEGAFGTSALAEAAVTAIKIARGAVTSEKLQDGSVTNLKIVDGAVGTSKLEDGAVNTSKIKDGAVTTDKIGEKAITEKKMADGAVTTDKMSDGAVTEEKLAKAFLDTIKHMGTDLTTLQNSFKNLSTAFDLLSKSCKNYANGFTIGEDGKLYLTNDGNIVSEGVELVATGGGSGGLAFNSGYMSEDGYLHLTLDGEDIEGYDPIYIGTVGGGSTGSRLVFAMYTNSNFSVLQTNKTAQVKFRFTSVDSATGIETGDGNLSIYVGGVLKENKTVPQGDNIPIDIFEHLAVGSNSVKLMMTDSYGATATRNLTITVETFLIEWNLGATAKNSGPLNVSMTPTGSGTKRLYLTVDGSEYDMQEVTTSGRKVDFSVPLSVGAHIISGYGTMTLGSSILPSDTLTCAVAQTEEGDGTVVIAANLSSKEVSQYSTIAIPHRVINPGSNPATVEYYVNDVLYATDSLDQNEHVWSYRTTEAGEVKLAIRCGGAEWSETITVSGLDAEISEITSNLLFKLDPNDITDLPNFTYGDIGVTLSEKFDTHNGGIQTDEEGIKCLKVIKGDRLTINYNMFATDARISGREFKFIYKVTNCSNYEANAISCMADNIGVKVNANGILMKSEQTTIEYPSCEDYKSELDVNIESDSDHRIMMLWENGTPAQAEIYATNDNFRQTNPVGITIGSDECDVIIYKVRIYTRDLTREEIKANFIADGKDGTEITSRHDRNQVYDSSGKLDPDKVATRNPGLRVLIWHASNISTAKTQEIKGFLTHKYVKGGAAHSWTANGVIDKAQGTSSLGYILAGCNEDFNCAEGFVLEDGSHIDVYSMTENSIGINYFNYKTNVASQEHVNNMLVSEWYNRFQPYIRAARAADPRVRDTVESHMAVLFFHNTGTEAVQVGPMTVQPDETVFYSLGNLNNSKKNLEVFAQNEEDDVITIELRNNISDQCRMKSADLTGEPWNSDGNFEFRHLAESMDPEEAKQLWQDFLTWVVSCDSEQATNAALDEIVTIDGQSFATDSAEYRIAKFRKEAAEHLVVDSLLFHTLVTLVFSQVDNRAKNTFWTYSNVKKTWHVTFAYDNDTAMGIDNEGSLTLKYGYMDYDKLGTRDVFNAADAVVFCMMWKSFPAEMKEMFLQLENAGAWNLDAFADLCDEQQALACESLWIEDAWRKDIDTLTVNGSTAYISMLNGKKRLQRRNFLHYQRPFISSYFCSSFSQSNRATIRGYTPDGDLAVPAESKMWITPYSDLWVTVQAGTTYYVKRAVAGETVELQLGTSKLNNTEIYPMDAAFLKDLGPLAGLYPGYIDVSPCPKLTRADIGSSVSGYLNTNLTDVGLENAMNLEYVNIENCPNFKKELGLAKNVNVKECYSRGSGVTGVTFADHGRLQKAYLNAVTSITAKNLLYVAEFTLQNYESLLSLNVVNSPSINTLDIATRAVNMIRVRLLEIVWITTVKAYTTLMRLQKMSGIDEAGYNAEKAVVTGSVFFDAISQTKYDTLVNALPDVNFTYGEFLEEHTVTFCNYDGTVLNVQKVEHGGTAEDPITVGYIKTPVKEPDDDFSYTYFKWDVPLENIVEDVTVTATYTQSIRINLVRYLKDGEVLQTYNVPAHGSCAYVGEDLVKSGYVWIGWDKVAEDVVEDMDINAVFIYPKLPATVKDLTKYDYAYSDDPDDNSAYTFGELYSIFKMGRAVDYGFGPGVLLKLIPRKALANGLITDTSMVFRYHAKGHYALADGSGMSNGDFYMVGVMTANRKMNSTNTNVGGWDACELRTWLNDTLFPTFEPGWRNFISLSDTLANAGNQSSNITTSKDYLRIPSHAEVGFDVAAVPYKNEIDANAEEVTFSCYTDNNSRIKKQFNGEGSAQYWWLRSADAGGSVAFRAVYYNGYSNPGNANLSYGVCVGFSV